MSVSETNKRHRRSFNPEFKAGIVSLCQLSGSTVASVCKATMWRRRRCDAGSARLRSMPGSSLV